MVQSEDTKRDTHRLKGTNEDPKTFQNTIFSYINSRLLLNSPRNPLNEFRVLASKSVFRPMLAICPPHVIVCVYGIGFVRRIR